MYEITGMEDFGTFLPPSYIIYNNGRIFVAYKACAGGVYEEFESYNDFYYYGNTDECGYKIYWSEGTRKVMIDDKDL